MLARKKLSGFSTIEQTGHLNGFRPGLGGRLDPELVESSDDIAAVLSLLAGHEHQAVLVILHSRILDLQQFSHMFMPAPKKISVLFIDYSKQHTISHICVTFGLAS
jgi:hypothetical protein